MLVSVPLIFTAQGRFIENTNGRQQLGVFVYLLKTLNVGVTGTLNVNSTYTVKLD